jgi:hypothetical protein
LGRDQGCLHANLQKTQEPQKPKASKARWPRWNVPAIPERGASHPREVLAKSFSAFLSLLSHDHDHDHAGDHEGDHDHDAIKKDSENT